MKVLKRFLIGFLIGVTINQVITLCLSMALGLGSYFPVSPRLSESMGSELAATILTFFVTGLLGSSNFLATLIFKNEKISLFLKSIICLLVIEVEIIVATVVLKWIVVTALGIISIAIMVGVIFLIIWIGFYFYERRLILAINKKISSIK